MAKRKNSFDPDALTKAGQEIANKHKDREQGFLTKVEPPKNNIEASPIIEKEEKTTSKKTTSTNQKTRAKRSTAKAKAVVKENTVDDNKTLLCRIGASYHKRLKLEAVKQDTSIRNLLETLIQENLPIA